MRGITAALLFLWAAISAPPAGAEEEAFIAPPPPDELMLDEARLFARSPERKQAIVAALAELEEKHGFRLYLVLYDSLFGHSLLDRAQVLREAWLGESPGMVLAVETDSGVFKVGQAAPEQAEIEPGKSIPLAGPTDLMPADLTRLLTELAGPLAAAPDREAFAERLGIGMATGASAIFDDRATAPRGGTKTRMIVLAAGVLAATGLVALLVVAGLKRAESKALERFVFPKIGVAMRLGAPYGGGKVSSRSFRSRAPER